jgi:membrane protein
LVRKVSLAHFFTFYGMFFKTAWKLTVHSFSEFIGNKVLKLSAALAFYTIFSLPGLLIIIVWLSKIIFGSQAVEDVIYEQLGSFIGQNAALDIQKAIRDALLSSKGSGWATTLGLITLIFGAGAVFIEIQDSINQVWHLKVKPKKGKGFLKILIDRLLSFSMIIVLGFLMLVSLLINGLMEIFITRLSGPNTEALLVYIINLIVAFIITVMLFSAIFKVLPDARIKWRHIMTGAITTAILFMAGKFLLTYYLSNNTISSTYGAAGTIIIILLWVYYSSMILYLGAIFTRVFAIHRGSHIYPSSYAVWVEQKEIESMRPLDRKQWADKPG